MNHDTPETIAALKARTAELEQQLHLSDEGVSRLAQRCLELEQQLLTFQSEQEKLPVEHKDFLLLLPQLFYDTAGLGFSPEECLNASQDVYDKEENTVSVTFLLPEDAQAVRVDPGELACILTDFVISDESITYQPANGMVLQADSLLFPDVDPQLILSCPTGFKAGMEISITYHYFPLEQLLQQQPSQALLCMLDDLTQKIADKEQEHAAEAQKAAEALQASQAEYAKLNQQLLEVQALQHEYQISLESTLASSSWRITAPLRALLNLLRGDRSVPKDGQRS